LGEDQIEITSLFPNEEIPYTFVMPSSYSNFKSLLQDQSIERQTLIIDRIRACNHISLLPENKGKMKVCELFFIHFMMLFRYFMNIYYKGC